MERIFWNYNKVQSCVDSTLLSAICELITFENNHFYNIKHKNKTKDKAKRRKWKNSILITSLFIQLVLLFV